MDTLSPNDFSYVVQAMCINTIKISSISISINIFDVIYIYIYLYIYIYIVPWSTCLPLLQCRQASPNIPQSVVTVTENLPIHISHVTPHGTLAHLPMLKISLAIRGPHLESHLKKQKSNIWTNSEKNDRLKVATFSTFGMAQDVSPTAFAFTFACLHEIAQVKKKSRELPKA